MATPLPQNLQGNTRRKFRHIVQHAEYLRAHSRDSAEHAAAVAIVRLARDLDRQLGDIADAIDWKLHSVAYDAVDLAIDPRDEPIRSTGDYQPRASAAIEEGRTA